MEQIRRRRMRLFYTYFSVMLVMYLSLLPLMHFFILKEGMSQANTVVGLLIFCGVQYLMLRHMNFSLKDTGFVWCFGQRNIIFCLLITVFFCLFLLIFKGALVESINFLHSLPLLQPKSTLSPIGGPIAWWEVLIMALVYVLFCPLQVFLIHCGFQYVLLDLFPTRLGVMASMVLAATLMSLAHLPIGVVFSIAVFFPALLWAYLYVRLRNAYLVTLSHAIIGIWALFLLDFGELFFLLHVLIERWTS